MWFVDADLYVQMFLKSRKYMYLSNIKVGSLQGRKDSITASISSSLKDIKGLEISYLLNKKGFNDLWLNNDLSSKILRLIESLLWLLMRLTEKIFALAINRSAVPKSLIFRAIKPMSNK
jgi:uncharacterized protein YjfI (DUF2170 family)